MPLSTFDNLAGMTAGELKRNVKEQRIPSKYTLYFIYSIDQWKKSSSATS